MGLKLKIASLWLPEFILKKEIDNVAITTIKGLNSVLNQHAPGKLEEISKKDHPLSGSLEKRRVIMAEAHNNRVNTLIETLGRENAIKIGREAMFDAGYKLGQEARLRLGVGNDFKDLQTAAKVLYKILGIEFKIENKDGNIVMTVNRCVLSKYYSPETCIILSAADEGVVSGLNENMGMHFKERITEGSSECMARISEVK